MKFNIAMVCDFFYPNAGGVENHILQLSQSTFFYQNLYDKLGLIQQGHKVIIITHDYGNRQGVRWITNYIKVYYCPFSTLFVKVTFPTMFGSLPLIRYILIREQIQIVHAHSATSQLGLECLLHGKILGIKTVFTDHSLFGFSDLACIQLNKLIKVFFSELDHAISVSHVSRENLCLRAALNPNIISVIPNAVNCNEFKPDASLRNPKDKTNIIVVSRLTYRKGVDLLIPVIKTVCKKFQDIHFIIAGDGPKKKELQQMINEEKLQEQVELLGLVQHRKVRKILCRGQIFLNTSLTEAFCIAIVEAASCGLLIVSTNVGGVQEVLPKNMMLLAKPNPKSIVKKLEQALIQCNDINIQKFHEKVKNLYNWTNVAKRTTNVYNKVISLPFKPLTERIKKCFSSGYNSGVVFLFVYILNFFLLILLEVLYPKSSIQPAINIQLEKMTNNQDQDQNTQYQNK